MTELKPCPFCGGKALRNHVGVKHIAFCTKCNASTGQFIISKERDEAWNKRLDQYSHDLQDELTTLSEIKSRDWW